MNNLVLIYTPFNKLIIKSLIDQGLIHKNSLIIDHTIQKSNDFANYIHLSNFFQKLYFIAKMRFFCSFFLKKHQITDFFIPHADGIVSNMFVRKVKRSNFFKLNLY